MRFVGEASIGEAVVEIDEDGTGFVLGSRCPKCGESRFPARGLCPEDLTAMQSFRFAGTGTIYELVEVHMAPEGFEAPYWVGFVDLDEGVRLFARIEWAVGEQPLVTGDVVSVSVEPVTAGPDAPLGPVFRRSGDHARQ